MPFVELLAGIAILAVVYHHVGYPALLALFARGRRLIAPQRATDADLPVISIVIAAYQEADHIAAKVQNCAALDYPRDRLEVIIACDGCQDATVDLARAASTAWWIDGLDVKVLDLPINRGKVAVLNEAVARARGEVVVATDASALLSVDALRRIAGWFSDPGIGVVCGTYVLNDQPNAGEAAYWRMQTGVLRREGQIAAPLGAHGAGYAFRMTAWTLLPPDTINDDFILPSRIIAQGYRGVYDDQIVALEMEPSNDAQSFRRRVRISAGNMQQLLRSGDLIDLRRPALAWLFLSGKGLRPIMPFVLIIAWAASLAAGWMGSLLFTVAWAGQTVGYMLGVFAPVLRRRLPARFAAFGRVLEALQYLVWGHTAGLFGALRYLGGLERGRWTRV
jgi:cellulose synthase/poly-beta-1,6-N-acetylglucosamine synthase-like glycosyltransferase